MNLLSNRNNFIGKIRGETLPSVVHIKIVALSTRPSSSTGVNGSRSWCMLLHLAVKKIIMELFL